MGVFQKLIFRLLLLLLPVCATAHAKVTSVNFVKHETNAQFISGDGHEIAFLQPESEHIFTANFKNGPTLIAKCADNFTLPLREIIFKNASCGACIQYNCTASNIARLLFPFHFFW